MKCEVTRDELAAILGLFLLHGACAMRIAMLLLLLLLLPGCRQAVVVSMQSGVDQRQVDTRLLSVVDFDHGYLLVYRLGQPGGNQLPAGYDVWPARPFDPSLFYGEEVLREESFPADLRRELVYPDGSRRTAAGCWMFTGPWAGEPLSVDPQELTLKP